MNKIDALRISLPQNEKKEALEIISTILDSNIKWTNADVVNEFEKTFSDVTKSKYAVAVSSGSTAIEIALIWSHNLFYHILPSFNSPSYNNKCACYWSKGGLC